tara:strand:- start:6024 stop:6401 length:378 start_codon:yes stop_codon:yes gene_type:complete
MQEIEKHIDNAIQKVKEGLNFDFGEEFSTYFNIDSWESNNDGEIIAYDVGYIMALRYIKSLIKNNISNHIDELIDVCEDIRKEIGVDEDGNPITVDGWNYGAINICDKITKHLLGIKFEEKVKEK